MGQEPSRVRTSYGWTSSSASSPRACARTRQAPIRWSACCGRSVSQRWFGLASRTERCTSTVWSRRTPFKVVNTLRARGFRFIEVDDEREAQDCLPMNFVALAPGEILMPAGGTAMRCKYEDFGVRCHVVDIGECIKAGGGIHCMTGFLRRDAVLSTTSGEDYGIQGIAE